MNLYQEIKDRVSTRQAAEFYGVDVRRNGMAVCPFHNDKNPSMKVDQRFHCFGCGADGDVIDFTAQLFQLDRVKAAEKLAEDFGFPHVKTEAKTSHDRKGPDVRFRSPRKSDAQKFAEAANRCVRVLSAYHRLLWNWKLTQEPTFPGADWPVLFVEALQKQAGVEYLLDMLIGGGITERAVWIAQNGRSVMNLEKRVSELTASRESCGNGNSRIHAAGHDDAGNQGQSAQDKK